MNDYNNDVKSSESSRPEETLGGQPTVRYEIKGDEYYARAHAEDSYISEKVDGTGTQFIFSEFPRDATIISTKNGEDPVISNKDEPRKS